MLNEGRRRRERGTDVVVGFVESHKRPLTEALLEGLEIVPESRSNTGGHVREMDLDAVLARRAQVACRRAGPTPMSRCGAPRQALGGRAELSTPGIDVITTLNIQHMRAWPTPSNR